MNGMTHDEAKRLADMICRQDTRQEITNTEWHAIANILRKHNRPAQPPLLYDRDDEAYRVQNAQHSVAYQVLEGRKRYRKQHNCTRVPGTETNAMLDDFIDIVARWFLIDPQLLSRDAILNIVKNGRPSLPYPRRLAIRPGVDRAPDSPSRA